MARAERIRYYDTPEDDFFQVGRQYKLDENYKYLQTGFFERLGSALTYALAVPISSLWCRCVLHVHFKGREKLRKQKGGFFIYANHTQPVGDVFHPALACLPKRIYTVVGVANMHLPLIGKILRPLGALPLPSTLAKTKEFNSAIKARINEGHPVVVYPEAHLWEYYTGVREFSDASFTYPVSLDKPIYVMTTTYQSRGEGKRPKITVFVDGPIECSGNTRREKTTSLRDAAYTIMSTRAAENNTCEYIKYVKK